MKSEIVLLSLFFMGVTHAAPSFFVSESEEPHVDLAATAPATWLRVASHAVAAVSPPDENEAFWNAFVEQNECGGEPPGEEVTAEERRAAAKSAAIEVARNRHIRVQVPLKLGQYNQDFGGYRLRKIEEGSTVRLPPRPNCGRLSARGPHVQLRLTESGQWYPGLPVPPQEALPDSDNPVLADIVVRLGSTTADDASVTVDAVPIGMVVYASDKRERVLGSVGSVDIANFASQETQVDPVADSAQVQGPAEPSAPTVSVLEESPAAPAPVAPVVDFPGGIEVEPLVATYMTIRGANVRSGPGTEYDKVGALAQYTRFTSIGTAKSNDDRIWVAFKLEDGTRAFISAGLVRRR